ncbi:MATE efflux family protein [Penicillium hispanicum]|uniref:MATE efflux family protein n=1 Tax=Penicillium hispanicum TaxID=1080232 RepID=UPI00253FF736|nr:MATE efflux family protein [Penicillium hispanicum]KAJ5595026.1 MATE efflux family protein [Penicillium hispanicum]
MAHETTSLIGRPDLDEGDKEFTSPVWEEITTLAKSSTWLVLVSYLQYSLPLTGLFFVGRLGTDELGAVSLGASITSITAYGVHQGLCSGMDTLCPLAHGSKRPDLAALYLQLTLVLLLMVTAVVGVAWWNSHAILQMLVSPNIAILTSRYLRVTLLGLPGHAAFETGKRFVNAQGIFNAPTYVLICVVPINIALHWLFVYKLEWGFIGAPLAAAISDTTLAAGLLVSASVFGVGWQLWPGLSFIVEWSHWRTLLRLAIPGSVTVLAEFLTFELLTLWAGKINDISLAAESVLNAAVAVALQLPFSLGNSVSLRVATLMGQKRPRETKIQIQVAFTAALFLGIINMATLMITRGWISRQLSTSNDVQELVIKTIPVCAILQILYSLGECSNGVMKGLKMQRTAGIISLICHYTIAIPTSFATALLLHWGLAGLWLGPVIGMTMFTTSALYCIKKQGFSAV